MKNKKRSVVVGLLLGLFFFIMLAFNLLTPKMSDDFAYAQSFSTKERLTDFFDIFPSLRVHALRMNGRLFAHFFAQLFLMLPDWIFDIVNAVVFTGQAYLLYRVARSNDRKNPLLLLGIFGSIWVFMPAFGQVNLWLDGACNYLWCTALGLLFLFPYVRAFMADGGIRNKLLQVLFFPFAVLAGGIVENGSAAFFGMSVLLLLLLRLVGKKKPKSYLIWGSVGAFLGYLSIYLAPAEWANKQTDFAAATLSENFARAGEMCLQFLPLLIAFALLLVTGLCRRTDKKRIWLALVFLAGSLAANFILMFADYYPERCASSVLVLLIAADAILLADWSRGAWKWLSNIVLCAVLLLGLLCVAVALPDVVRVYTEINDNVARIEAQKSDGADPVLIPMVRAETRFCGLYDLKYIDCTTADTWPNVSMAVYYGVESIKGEE